ncbi:hypothetical protein CJ030_MR4G022482 [Morella rubra]|uniref:Uncharacterized protein n=1 Tax=Morella rubra TaxID=262757 RepID=A0A6A1VZM0_9ROSI|nr:hypothetical protein CJ030_MR4G022489 [Morella rubra]KAB1216037.1 hypothetical protein CJ030_MR4G022482 [Morella rubra]
MEHRDIGTIRGGCEVGRKPTMTESTSSSSSIRPNVFVPSDGVDQLSEGFDYHKGVDARAQAVYDFHAGTAMDAHEMDGHPVTGHHHGSWGKCLRCNSGGRAIGAANPSQGASNDSPSPVETISPRTTQSSCASTSGIKQVRGKMRRIALEKARITGKLSVHFPEGSMGDDDKASSMLSSHIGSLV